MESIKLGRYRHFKGNEYDEKTDCTFDKRSNYVAVRKCFC